MQSSYDVKLIVAKVSNLFLTDQPFLLFQVMPYNTGCKAKTALSNFETRLDYRVGY
jgi:hypothetical protein